MSFFLGHHALGSLKSDAAGWGSQARSGSPPTRGKSLVLCRGWEIVVNFSTFFYVGIVQFVSLPVDGSRSDTNDISWVPFSG